MSAYTTPLLTAHLFISKKCSGQGLEEVVKNLEEGGITVRLYGPEDALVNTGPKYPRIYVSLGPQMEEFKSLYALPLHERKRWLHYNSAGDINPSSLFYCWLHCTEPLPENKDIQNTRFISDTPLVSVFTAAYRSRDKILRPYKSLLKQTYTNWEWVIVDDSGDDDMTYKQDLLTLEDPRVRRYRQDGYNGYIGAIKRYAAGLCTGQILVELDHDDELTPDCLEKIVKAFRENPDCGFVYGDCAEVYVGSNADHWYGRDVGYGYSLYYRVWVHEMNRWQNVQKHTTMNGNTIRHLIGLPNHPRAWTRDFYHLIGGHREELLVADDYDMLVRSFLHTRFVAIPHLLYIQYRNQNGDNSTFHRNRQIQILVKELYDYYFKRIDTRIRELGVSYQKAYSRIWDRSVADPARKTAHIVNEDTTGTSILFPIPYSCPTKEYTKLYETLQKGLETDFKHIEVVIVGRIPTDVELFAAKAPMGAIRWWPMEPKDSLETCIKYARYCASYRKKEVVLPACL
ncbi:glycosyltransferase [Clostridium thermarum]|uniref:glycosyltransferase n=1 Tax=Clostridium thermarum TaxID=1716543 RepID=UPI0013D455D7|nr:glycosyltransferase [Clostridium thermarum]